MLKILLLGFVVVVIGFILLAAAIMVGKRSFRRQVATEVQALFQAVRPSAGKVITEADLTGLPEPVQRWLRFSQIVGKAPVATVRLKQRGFFRLGPEKGWLPFTAEQYYTVAPPAFLWATEMHLAPGFTIIGRDRYWDGHGNMLIKPLGLFPAVNAGGPEIAQGALLRFLNEMLWFPSAALQKYLVWTPVDAHAARVTMSYQGVTASAIFYFDTHGKPVNMVADRYRSLNGGKFSLDTWATPLVNAEFATFQGIRIPVRGGQGVWQLRSGDFTYIKVDIVELEYNNPSRYE
jgi:hypothetical protein